MAGCLIELEHGLACGDGVVDVLAGEQCDPNAPGSPHRTYCLDKGLGGGKDGRGEALCNDTCQIEADWDICTFCGDGIARGTEACDGADLRGATCPSKQGQIGCWSAEAGPDLACTLDTSGCDPCGDGVFSPEQEECDFSTQCGDDADCPGEEVCDVDKKTCALPGELGVGEQCTELDGPKGAYQHGLVTNADCTSDCVYERRRCNYCGDGELDGAYADYTAHGDFVQVAEVCDGDAAQSEALSEYCRDLCTGGPNNTTLALRCEFECNDSCSGFTEQAWEYPIIESARCCVIGGEPCDLAGTFPCCYALDHPDDAASACVDALPLPTCRSG